MEDEREVEHNNSPKVKRQLIMETDYYGETRLKQKLTTYTWALKNFKTFIKLNNHADTKSFTLCDDSDVECFLSANFSNWMSVHLTFSNVGPVSYSYEIHLHLIDENNMSSYHDVFQAKNVIKGQKISFENFLILENEEFDNFLVNEYLFLWVEILRIETSFTFRDVGFGMMEIDMSNDILNLQKKKLLTDLTLVTQEKEFQAHKCILAARSPVFFAMFQNEMLENQKNKVVLEDTDSESLQKLLDFVYSNKVDNISTDTEKLLALADRYDINGLKLLCAQELYSLTLCRLVNNYYSLLTFSLC